jgi:hypothetical protein
MLKRNDKMTGQTAREHYAAQTALAQLPRRGACESCHRAPGTTWIELPAMPDYGCLADTFRLCDECAEFGASLGGQVQA